MGSFVAIVGGSCTHKGGLSPLVCLGLSIPVLLKASQGGLARVFNGIQTRTPQGGTLKASR